MKRQGSRQTTLDACFNKRSRVTTGVERSQGEAAVVWAGKTALEMIAEAYADANDVLEEQEEAVLSADSGHGQDYADVTAGPSANQMISSTATHAVPLEVVVCKVQLRKKKEDPAIVEIGNGDGYGLFRATAVHMFYHETGEGAWQKAERYSRKTELICDAVVLRARAKIEHKSAYGIKDAKEIFEYLQKKYPDEYRILIFTPTSQTKTAYSSGNNARYNICLYYHDGHFDLMKTPQKFFRKRHYCVECEKAYVSQANHAKCRIRCRQCFGIGHGFPCEGNWPIELECPDCHKLFANQDCMDAHKPFSCNTFHRCVYCNLHYRVRPEQANQGHKCDEKFCRRCYKKHRKDPGDCFCPIAQSQIQQEKNAPNLLRK